MLDHIGVQVSDVDASVRWYLAVFGPVGLREAVRFPIPAAEGGRSPGDVVGLAVAPAPQLWFSPAFSQETRELHLALAAPDRAAVDSVHEAALAEGAEVLHAPREWPEYHPGYYGVFLRDPDGHNVEAVHHGG